MLQKLRCYDSYVQLPALLELQSPRTPPSDRPTWAAERFFIICHQTSELCLSQVLLDLRLAAELSTTRSDWRAVRTSLSRAASLTLLLARVLAELAAACPRSAFSRFRTSLQGTSASESSQFNEFLRLLDGSHVDLATIRSALRGTSACTAPDTTEACSATDERAASAHTLELLLRGVAVWRALHIAVTKHFIANLPGTGGTLGVRYLSRRFAEATHTAQSAATAERDGVLEAAAEALEASAIEELLSSLRGLETELRQCVPANGED